MNARHRGCASALMSVVQRLDLLEERPHVVPCPAGIAECRPVVVVLTQSAHVDHCIDRARPAEQLAARPVAAAVVQRGLRLAAIHPVEARVVEALAVADRHAHEEAVVAAARLEQQHAVFAALGQPCRDDAPCGAAAHDNVVELVQARRVAQATRARGGPLWRIFESTVIGAPATRALRRAPPRPLRCPLAARPRIRARGHATAPWSAKIVRSARP